MYMKVFPHGKGTGNAAVDYLTRLDYAGRAENPPKVLRGDTEQSKQIINSLDTKWKFTAGVLSWHPDDIVTVTQEEAIMNDFEELAFAGLDKDAYNILWVRHKHANHHELHFVMPRVELSTGKAYNACPPNWQKDFDVFRDMHNVRENWARPDDPSRARMYAPEHANLQKARLKRWGTSSSPSEREQTKQAIHDYVISRIEQGTARNREDIIEILTDVGLTINRQGKDYISVKDLSTGAKFRLKGNIYAEQWEYSEDIGTNKTSARDDATQEHERSHETLTRQEQSRTSDDRRNHQREIENLERQYIKVIEKRSHYNRERYRARDREYAKEYTFKIRAMQSDFWQAMHAPVSHGTSPNSRDNTRELGTDSMAQFTNNQPQDRDNNVREIQGTTTERSTTRTKNPQGSTVGNMEFDTRNTRWGEIHHTADGSGNVGYLRNHGEKSSLETWGLEECLDNSTQSFETITNLENSQSNERQNQNEDMNNERVRNTFKGYSQNKYTRERIETTREGTTLKPLQSAFIPNANANAKPTNTNSNTRHTDQSTNSKTNELTKSNRATLDRTLASHQFITERLERFIKLIQYIGKLINNFKQETHVKEQKLNTHQKKHDLEM